MAVVTAYSTLDLVYPTIFYGDVLSYDASHITLSDGWYTGVYYGSFTYSMNMLAGGTITGYDAYVNSELTGTVTGGDVDALTFYSYLNAGNASAAYTYAFRLPDQMNGSALDDRLAGFGGDDTLNGRAGADFVRGDDGTDLIDGGPGNDQLAGNAGNDRFRFDDALGAGTNRDWIFDFTHKVDRILLDDDTFTALGQGGLRALAAENFHGGAPQDADDFIIYKRGTGTLYYDADGAGPAKAIAFATLGLDTHPMVNAADFKVIG